MFKLYSNSVTCNKVYSLYKHLLNSYVSDFYLEDHWHTKLPASWRLFLEKLDVHHIARLLECQKLNSIVSPLSILCLQEILQNHSVLRHPTIKTELLLHNPCFMKLMWKNVKLKKRHEIEIISNMCYQIAKKTNCFNIIDVGSGVGHLSRMLAYGYGFTVVTFEANKELSEMAKNLDIEFEKKLEQKKITHLCQKRVIHVNHKVESNITADILISLILSFSNNQMSNFRFGIVGLHPCGNLGSILLKLFKECPNAVFINIASCCYMKLSLNSSEFKGYPLSNFHIKNNFHLDYMSCETACHAIENFINKLKTENHCYLKIHAFRAALESLLVEKDTAMKHCAVANVKYDDKLNFVDYCNKALRKINVQLSEFDIKYFQSIVEQTWDKVVKFYSVRLFFAPIIESIILYDRLLYLKQSFDDSEILPVFNCEISPRNHVLSALKHM
ncbi:hypothetical protein GWI33_013566 [Rhynchophorus ferrugineus]|uniref:Methyltransferase domain-containing protein n=1 Tax=Rhynchophorus ferrugineus TaxID=354439 RepID=A0A834IGS8_RHYFE|nr:hypothetical protein GWI33_013566 [Rhynchophorus ferrugineus]